MGFFKRWRMKRKAMKDAESFVVMGETVQALRAYRAAIDPCPTLVEAKGAINKIRSAYGLHQLWQ